MGILGCIFPFIALVFFKLGLTYSEKKIEEEKPFFAVIDFLSVTLPSIIIFITYSLNNEFHYYGDKLLVIAICLYTFGLFSAFASGRNLKFGRRMRFIVSLGNLAVFGAFAVIIARESVAYRILTGWE